MEPNEEKTKGENSLVEIEVEIEQLEEKIAPGRGYNRNETMIADR
jgi:hypothetical protein